MILRIILIISLALLSCSKTNHTSYKVQKEDTVSVKLDTVRKDIFDYESQFKLENYLTEELVDEKKITAIDFDCAILIYPTLKQIDEMKKTEGEESFYIGADDSNWYHAMAIDMIDSVGIRKITVSEEYLRLKGQNTAWDLDIRKSNLPAWNLIFFKQTKEPKIISTIDLNVDEIKDYFEIR